MKELNVKELLGATPFEEKSVPAVEVNTYLRLGKRTCFLSKERRGFSYEDFVPLSAIEFLEKQLCAAACLMELGVEKGDPVVVFSQNSVRYAAEVFAIQMIGGIFVPIYPSTTEEEVDHIARHSESRILFAGDTAEFQKAKAILDKVKSPLRWVIVNYGAGDRGRNVLSFDEMIQKGRISGRLEAVAARLREVGENDSAALIYTPGTTGAPKGAILTHGNFLSQRSIIETFRIGEKDTRLAHLPFSHVFGLSADLFASAMTGTKMCVTRSFETEDVMQYISDVRPTVMCSVPRMYEKICVNILQRINQQNPLRRRLNTMAVQTGREYYIRQCAGENTGPGLRLAHAVFAPVYARIRRSLCMSQVKLLFSGGGPLPIDIAYFFGGIGLPIMEGYGLTETSPIINVNPPERNKPGTVGPPVSGAMEKISDEGEILVKGPQVFRGYHRNDEENLLSFTPDGFFKTGDVGVFDEDGYLTITGRIKDLIITSGGKNIAPLNIEKRFENDPMINYLCVIGDGKKYLTALVVPNFTMLRQFAMERHIRYNNEEDLVRDPLVIAEYRKRIAGVSDTLAKYEQIKKFTLIPQDFSTKGGELSPTFKFRRRHVCVKYADVIECMYPSSDAIKDDI